MKKFMLSALALFMLFGFLQPVAAQQYNTELSFGDFREKAIREGKQLAIEEYARIVAVSEGEELERMELHGYILASGFISPGNHTSKTCNFGLFKSMTSLNYNDSQLLSYANYGQQPFYKFEYVGGITQQWRLPLTECKI